MIINNSMKINEKYDSGSRFMDQAQEFINKNRNRTIKKSDIISIANKIGDVNPKLVNNFIELRKMDGIKIVDESCTEPKVSECSNKSSKSLDEDTVKKSNGKWTNRGKDGKEHGEFDTKSEADAQRRAMYASGFGS